MSLAEKEETPVRSSSQAKAASRIESVMGGLAPTKAACRANVFLLAHQQTLGHPYSAADGMGVGEPLHG